MTIQLKREHNLYPNYKGMHNNRYYQSLITKDTLFYVNHKETNKDISVIMFKKTNSTVIEFQKTTQNKNEWDYVSPTLYRILNKKI